MVWSFCPGGGDAPIRVDLIDSQLHGVWSGGTSGRIAGDAEHYADLYIFGIGGPIAEDEGQTADTEQSTATRPERDCQ